MAVALAPISQPPVHAATHNRQHSAAEGLAILGVGGVGMGIGLWMLLSHPSTSTPSTCTGTNPAIALGLTPGQFVTAPAGPPNYSATGLYVLDGSLVKHAVPSLAIAAACGYNLGGSCVRTLSSEQLYCIPTGSSITSSTCLPGISGCTTTGGGPGEPPTSRGYGAGSRRRYRH